MSKSLNSTKMKFAKEQECCKDRKRGEAFVSVSFLVGFSGALSDCHLPRGLSIPIGAHMARRQNIVCCQEWRKHKGIIQGGRSEFRRLFVEFEFRSQAANNSSKKGILKLVFRRS